MFPDTFLIFMQSSLVKIIIYTHKRFISWKKITANGPSSWTPPPILISFKKLAGNLIRKLLNMW